jgi:phosphoribosylamine--glycine ligase
MAFVSGRQVRPMVAAQDHKRAFDGDTGPNTGGMGAYTESSATGKSGLSFLSEADYDYAVSKILQPVADAMADAGTPLSGVLYGGLMKTPSGIKVIEFNARFGDPETEVVLPRLESDIFEVFEAVATSSPLPELRWKDASVMGVVMASKGYPGHYAKGAPIAISPSFSESIYHMGTKWTDDGLVTAGGRVLMVVSEAPTMKEAASRCYAGVAQISCDNLFYRKDIAKYVL